MENHMSTNEAILVMLFACTIAGSLLGMNTFANKADDIRFNLNDVYMALMMTGGMFFLMGVYYKSVKLISVGISVSLIGLICIRNQLFINKNRFLNSMIPHHSMAIMMTKRLKEKDEELPDELNTLLNDIIITQEQEIEIMKKIKV
jgi:hypothetical protein